MNHRQAPIETRLIDLRDPLRALTLLTRLPVPGADGQRGAAAAWAWPIAGLIVGGLAAMAALAAHGLGLSAGVAAGAALITATLVTGGLHDDGLADCADGFWGGYDSARRLEIMRDSRVGSYGVLALIFAVGLRWLVLAQVIAVVGPWLACIVPAMLSRAAMAGVMAALPFARQDGLARHVGRPKARTALAGIALSCGAAVVIAGAPGLVAAVAAAAGALLVVQIARAKIGGQTGDVLGATQVMSEAAALIGLAAVLA